MGKNIKYLVTNLRNEESRFRLCLIFFAKSIALDSFSCLTDLGRKLGNTIDYLSSDSFASTSENVTISVEVLRTVN